MTRKKAGNNKFLKEFNQTGILDLIRIHKAVSRAELSVLTGLSPTAIGVIVSNLLEAGYIIETGIGESKGGRRPVLLELKPKSFFSVGVDMDVNYISLILMDSTGEVIAEKLLPKSADAEFEEILQTLLKEIERFISEQGVPLVRLLGIGLSIPGMVDSKAGKVILAPNLGWRDVDVREPLVSLLHVPVYVENEAMSSAIGENWIGSCQGVSDFVCINIRSGIGSGIFIGGRPYRGTGGSAGEVGHVVVDDNGPKCGCGNYGCLETLASTTRMVEKAKKLVKQGTVSSLNDVENIEELGIDSIIQAAGAGDETAKSILLESARYLGIAISNIVNTLNPSRIVLGKEFVKFADLTLEQIQKIVASKALQKPAGDVEIIPSVLGEKASTLGAAIIPIKVLYGK